MANVDGEWNCVTRTPIGEQTSILTVRSNGGTFIGTNSGTMGAMDIVDGKVDGDVLSWKMEVTTPFPMTLACKATVAGDSIEGEVSLGAFGTAPMSGVRRG